MSDSRNGTCEFEAVEPVVLTMWGKVFLDCIKTAESEGQRQAFFKVRLRLI